MNVTDTNPAPFGLWAALATQRAPIWIVGIFSVFVNILMLTGPIFALQVYDRVLSSRSQETLVALTLLMAFLFIVMGIIDHMRKRISARIGERIVAQIEKPVFHAALRSGPAPADRARHLQDLETLRQFFASPVFAAIFDLPWVPVFLLAIALFHPALGWLAFFGAMIFLLPVLQVFSRQGSGQACDEAEFVQAKRLASQALAEPEMIRAFHLGKPVAGRWQALQQNARHAAIRLQDRRAATNSVGLTVRLFLQSAIIALGAYLVLQNQLTPGAIIAATVLLARALGPLNMIGQNWLMLRSAGLGWRRTSHLLANIPEHAAQRKAAASGAGLQVQRVTVFAPGARQATLRLIDFSAPPGQVVGIIGPSGAGKTTLLMALAGLWPLTDGQIRLGDTPLRAANASLTHNIGLLAQAPAFLPGTIAENISRFQPDADPDHVARAAIHAAAHDHILTLSRGYDTPLEGQNNPLAAGLIQRIALARAVFSDPDFLLLDEPANNLDGEGMSALSEIVQAAGSAGKTVVIATQRPSSLQDCDLLLVLQDGMQKDFGAVGKVLETNVKNVRPLRVAQYRASG